MRPGEPQLDELRARPRGERIEEVGRELRSR